MCQKPTGIEMQRAKNCKALLRRVIRKKDLLYWISSYKITLIKIMCISGWIDRCFNGIKQRNLETDSCIFEPWVFDTALFNK